MNVATAKIPQTDVAENALPQTRTELEAERRQQTRQSLAQKLRDHTTMRAIAHNVRDRDGMARVSALLDDVFILRAELITWCEGSK